MEKVFVNALAYSRVLKLLMVFILVFVVVVDVAIVAIVARVMDYASPEERTKIIRLTALLLISSAAGFPLFYVIRRSLREQWIRIDDRGITYNSWAKKVSAAWDEVTGISIVPRGRLQMLRVDTRNGRFYASPILVDRSAPIPQIKLSISSLKLLYPNGRTREADIRNSDVYMALRGHISGPLSALPDARL